MVFAPVRGIFMLGRTAFLIAAAAAVPVVLKKNKKLADQVGDFMMKTGENLKKGYGSAAGTPEKEPAKVSESVVQKPKAGAKAAPKATTGASVKPAKGAARPAKKTSPNKPPSSKAKKSPGPSSE